MRTVPEEIIYTGPTVSVTDVMGAPPLVMKGGGNSINYIKHGGIYGAVMFCSRPCPL